jgi:hypothetical protein
MNFFTSFPVYVKVAHLGFRLFGYVYCCVRGLVGRLKTWMYVHWLLYKVSFFTFGTSPCDFGIVYGTYLLGS